MAEYQFWGLLSLIFLVAEGALSGSFVACFFALGAVCAAFAAAAGLQLWLQSAAFAATAIVSLLLARKPLLAWASRKAFAHPVDSFVHQHARVVVAMAPGADGAVQLHGSRWTACNVGQIALAEQDDCEVMALEGIRLQVAAAGPRT